MTLASGMILTGMSLLVYANYWYQVHILGDYAAYPEEVAKKLRRAIHYTNIDFQPANAFKYYRQALELAAQLGMDPFSDEIMGLKIQVAYLFEKSGALETASKTLRTIRNDCVDWLEGRQSEAMAKISGSPQGRHRARVLFRTIAVSLKMGELYDLLGEHAQTEESLSWAVTAILKEEKRRELDGPAADEEEADWLQQEQIGAAFEDLGTHYSRQGQNHLAVPLFLKALARLPPKSCHAVVLMNNLATAIALQNAPAEAALPVQTNAAQIETAQQWGHKALTLGQSISASNRTLECEQGCAVATINLGDFAMMEGRTEEARVLWQKGLALSKAADMAEGVQKAEAALKSVSRPV